MDTSRFVKELVNITGFELGIARITLSKTQCFFYESYDDYCLINEKGLFLVEYHGDTIEIEGERLLFIFPFEGNVARALNTSGRWELISNNGDRVSENDYLTISSFRNGNAIVRDRCKHTFSFSNDVYGVIRTDGSIVIQPKFSYIVREGYEFITSGGRFDSAGRYIVGETIIDPIYDSCRDYGDGFILVSLNNQYGLVDKHGQLIVDCLFESLERKCRKSFFSSENEDEKWSTSQIGIPQNGHVFCRNNDLSFLISNSGSRVYLPNNVREAQFYDGGLIAIKDISNKWSLINENHNCLLLCDNDEIVKVYNGFVVTKFYVYNSNGENVFTLNGGQALFDEVQNTFIVQYHDVSPACDNGRMIATVRRQRYDKHGYMVALNGDQLYHLDSRYIACRDYHEGLAAVARLGTKPIVYNLQLDDNYKCKNLGSLKAKSIFVTEKEKRFTELVIEQAEFGHRDIVDYSMMSYGGEKDVVWGYVDTEGREVVPCQFSEAMDFSNGIGLVKYKDYWGGINQLGNYVIPRRYRIAYGFSEGYAVVRGRKMTDSKNFLNRYGYKWYLINNKGKIVSRIEGYEYLARVSNGLILARRLGRYGYLHIDGRVAIPFMFETASSFKDGEAVVTVRDNDSSFRIDLKGNIIVLYHGGRYHVPIDFSRLHSIGEWINGRALINYSGYKGVIDLKGKMVLPPLFDILYYDHLLKRWVVDLDGAIYQLSEEDVLQDTCGNNIKLSTEYLQKRQWDRLVSTLRKENLDD